MKIFYSTWQEASRASMMLGIETMPEYCKRYKEDIKLPSRPDSMYMDFPDWRFFLRREKKKKFYLTWQEASKYARKLGFRTNTEYSKGYKKNPRLPSHPECEYIDFPGWTKFLTGKERKVFYPTWKEASKAVQLLGFKTKREYKRKYKSDSKLPSTPNETYSDFPGFPIFVGKIK